MSTINNNLKSNYNIPYPKQPHLSIPPHLTKDSIIIVGDVHGCLDELKELLMKCNYSNESSTLILVGDLVNKGPYSSEVIRYVRELNAYVVRGNHDDFALSLIYDKREVKGCEYINDLSNDDIQWLTELPYTISLPSFNSIVVHAGLIPGIPLELQSVTNMVTMRNIQEVEENNDVILRGTSDTSIGKPWVDYWTTGPHIYFGHDAKRELQLTNYCTGLDSGCVYGKKLSAIILPSKDIIQVDAKRIYEIPKSE